jgi:hypothetical protein
MNQPTFAPFFSESSPTKGSDPMASDNEKTCGLLSRCGCILLFNLIIGPLMNHYCFGLYFGIDLPWWGDILCGLVLAEILFPCMVVGWIVNISGVPAPFWPMDQGPEQAMLLFQEVRHFLS